MYYLIDFDTLDVLFQHAKKTVLKKYITSTSIALATEIIGNSEGISDYLTKKEMITMYENITLESLPVHLSPDIIAGMVFDVMCKEIYPEPPKGKIEPAPPTEKPIGLKRGMKPKSPEVITTSKKEVNSKTVVKQDKYLVLGLETPKLGTKHAMLCDIVGDKISFSELAEKFSIISGKDIPYANGYIKGAIRRNYLEETDD